MSEDTPPEDEPKDAPEQEATPLAEELQAEEAPLPPGASAKGGFLGGTLSVFFAHAPALLGIGMLASVPAALMTWLGHPAGPDGHWVLTFAVGVLQLIGFAVAVGVVFSSFATRPSPVSTLLGRALRRAPSMVVASGLSLLAVLGLYFLGMAAARHAGPMSVPVGIATIVICIGVSSALRVSVVAAYAENCRGTRAMARSVKLTRGRRLRIFLTEMALAFMLAPSGQILEHLEPGTVAYFFAQLAVDGLGIGFGAAFAAVVYAHLRQRTDGAEPETILEGF